MSDSEGETPDKVAQQIAIIRSRSEKRRRKRRVHIRLNDEEYLHACELAAIAGLKPPKLARELLNGTSIKPAKKLPPEVYRAIVSFGNNLNQIAKAMNTDAFDCREELEALRNEAKRIIVCLSQS